MGIDTTAKVLYGVKVSTKIFKKTKMKERSCKHNIDTSLNFCPVCGKKVWNTYEKESIYSIPNNVEIYNDDDSLPDLEYKIILFYNEGDKEAVIGIEIDSMGEHEETFTNMLKEYSNEEKESIKESIIKFCEHFNIEGDVSKLKFGSFLMMDYS